MQSDNGSPSPSQKSEIRFPLNAPPIIETFVISCKDAILLEEYVEEFQEGDADVRNTIIATAMAELCALRPPSVLFNKMEASKVCVYVHNILCNSS
jgi:hypothetical protein